MNNLSHNQKVLISATAVIIVAGALFIGLKMQANSFAVKGNQVKTVSIPEAQNASQSQVLGDETEKSYNNPLKGIYVNPFER